MKKFVPDTAKCVQNLLFGCDLSGGSEDLTSLLSGELPAWLRSLILPFALCTGCSALKKGHFPDVRLDAGGFLPEGVADNLFSFDEKRVSQFIRYCGNAVRQAHTAGVHSLLLDGDWNGCMEPERDPDLPAKILKKLSPVLEETGMFLLLPVRFPLSGEQTADQLKLLLNRTGSPRIKVRLDVRYPAPGNPFPDPEEAGLLLQETASLRFTVHEGDGAEPDPGAVAPWITALALYGYGGPCIFHFTGPVQPSVESILNRSAEWTRFLKEKYHVG